LRQLPLSPVKRNADLDRLRAIAIVFTVVTHLKFLWGPWRVDWLYAYTEFGTGVDLLFVVSGFIVTRTLIREIETSGDPGRSVMRFYLKRAFRILPVAYLWLLVALVLSHVFAETGHFPSPGLMWLETGAAVLNIFNLLASLGVRDIGVGYGPYWTLSIEEQFYFLLPAFLLVCRSTRERIAVTAIVILAVDVLLRPGLALSGFTAPFIAKFTLTKVDGLALGVLLCLTADRPAWQAPRPRWQSTSVAGTGLVLALISALALVPGLFEPERRATASILAMPLVGLTSGVLVWLASYDSNLILAHRRLSPVLHWLGSRSYSIYLAHFPMIWVSRWLIDQGLQAGLFAQTTIFLLLSGAATEASYRLVEQPFIALGRYCMAGREVGASGFESKAVNPLY
jgi:peptidoglycan/LPS O-acetylase OafA/YrhL